MTSNTGDPRSGSTPLRRGLALAAVAGTAFAGGVAVGQTGSDDDGPEPVVVAGPAIDEPAIAGTALADGALSTADSCAALLDHYVDLGRERVTAWGWGSDWVYLQDGLAGDAASVEAVPRGADMAEQGSSDTGTNVQEAGVDEPDVVKTDGEILVRVHRGRLEVFDVSGRGAPELLGTADLEDLDDAELLLVGDTVVAIGADGSDSDPVQQRVGWDFPTGDARTRVSTFDLSDATSPTLVSSSVYNSSLVAARQHGDTVRLVISAGLPELDFVEPRAWRSEETALEHNRRAVEDSELSDWLPTVTTTDAEGATTTDQVLGCGDVAMPTDDAGLGTVAVVGFEPDSPETWDSTAVLTDSPLVYVSTDRLYLATSAMSWWWGGSPDTDQAGLTSIYAFELDGTDAEYVASGEVRGAVADRWSMDSVEGSLRVAVGPTERTGDFNSVVTLEERGDRLVEVGRVDRLGVGEQIQSVRWFDDLALVVTFRQTDPFYVIDLDDPADPRLLGELKIPGFSSYLHPVSGHQVLGMGMDANPRTGATRGAQAGLFDIRDVTDPRRTDVWTYQPETFAQAGTDPRQFTWLSDRRTALTVITRGWEGQTGWVSALTVGDDGTLSNRMIRVAYGLDVVDVRTVPLPDGRVVLMAGETVRFLKI